MEINGKTYNLYWGDLHNHNAVGYAKGSLARSIDIAKEHLDFFAFTGHASWHDMPVMPKDQHLHWVKGFETHSAHWEKTRKMIKDANSHEFVAFLGYEWHSSAFGDYCLIFQEDQPDLYLPEHVNKLLDFAQEKGALAIPHHMANKEGHRGANWNYFRPELSPVVEIFSEHGCTVSDRSPYPMILHSFGGRSTENTIYHQLAKGKRFGFVASSDDHFGFPGAYGEGITGVWAEDLSAESIFEAIRKRRTIAVTGDRISLDFSINGSPMGSELADVKERKIEISVKGGDSIDMIQVIRNGKTLKRFFPEDQITEPSKFPGKGKFRIQYGWGPWNALDLERTCIWNMEISIKNGRFIKADPCFQSGPFNEKLRDRLRQISDHKLLLESFTSRRQAYLQDPTKSILCSVEAAPNAIISIELMKPVNKIFEISLQKLINKNEVIFTGGFTTESLIVHRYTDEKESNLKINWQDEKTARTESDQYHVLVRQHNMQYAWSSPIWVGKDNND
jgi:Protein of unknown function (DUF3604)